MHPFQSVHNPQVLCHVELHLISCHFVRPVFHPYFLCVCLIVWAPFRISHCLFLLCFAYVLNVIFCIRAGLSSGNGFSGCSKKICWLLRGANLIKNAFTAVRCMALSLLFSIYLAFIFTTDTRIIHSAYLGQCRMSHPSVHHPTEPSTFCRNVVQSLPQRRQS